MHKFPRVQRPPLVFVLDQIRSGYNVGAAFRIADGLAVNRIYLCGITVTPPHREIRKTALGAEETVAWTYAKESEEMLLNLKKNGYHLIAIEQDDHAIALDRFQHQEVPTALILRS